MAAQHLHGLAVEGVDQAGGGVAVGDVDDVVLNVEAVGEEEGAVAPGVLEVAVAVEDEDGRLLALEGVDAVLGVGGDGGDHGEGLALGQLGPVFLEGVGVVAGAEGGHGCLLSGVDTWWGYCTPTCSIGRGRGFAFRFGKLCAWR